MAAARVLPIGNTGKRDTRGGPDDEMTTLQSVVGEGLKYRGRFALQTNGLTASSTEIAAQNRTVIFDLVGSYSGNAVTGFQVGTSATINPGNQGDAANPANALALSLDEGLAENPNFLEVWEPDVLNPDMQGVLQTTEAELLGGPAPQRPSCTGTQCV